MSKKDRKSKRKLFNPDKIATAVHQAVIRDFKEAQHVYCLDDSVVLTAYNRQVNELLKKYCSTDQDIERLTAETYAKFRVVNTHMGRTNDELKQLFKECPSKITRDTDVVYKIIIRARSLIKQALGPFSWEAVFDRAQSGPGTTIGCQYIDTSPEAKFTFPISVTPRAKERFVECLWRDPSLRAAIENLNREAGPEEVIGEPWLNVRRSSRSTTVDKTTEKRRFITITNSANMYLQQGMMVLMYERMLQVGLDLSILPDIHKELARLASITLAKATVDWSSASDCVAIELVRGSLPPDWFSGCWDLRDDFTEIDGEEVELNMISTMGNAVTFPLETLIFWAYAISVDFTLNNPHTNTVFPSWESMCRSSVFGDDCIVPTAIAHSYIEFMEGLGFIVNEEKSFFDGELRFRESCGGDYLIGQDVRPFCLRAPTSTRLSALEPWLYIMLNSLLKKYISYYGELSYVYDKHLFRCLFSLFREYKLKVKLVPPYFPDDAGLRINSDIQRLVRLYRVQLSRLSLSDQGTYEFRYCHFRYWKRRDRFEELRWSIWIKTPVSTEGKQLNRLSYPERKKGGYVVSKSYSAHWVVPSVPRLLV
jgi:hypothetical protein